jgi:hypothetical protein
MIVLVHHQRGQNRVVNVLSLELTGEWLYSSLAAVLGMLTALAIATSLIVYGARGGIRRPKL